MRSRASYLGWSALGIPLLIANLCVLARPRADFATSLLEHYFGAVLGAERLAATALAVCWFALGTRRFRFWSLALISIIWLSECDALGFSSAHFALDVAASLAPLLWFRYIDKLRVARSQPIDDVQQTSRMQFSIKSILALMALVAVTFSIYSNDSMYWERPNIVMAAILSTTTAGAVRAVLGRGNPWRRLGYLLVYTLAAGVFFTYVLDRTRGGCFVGASAVPTYPTFGEIVLKAFYDPPFYFQDGGTYVLLCTSCTAAALGVIRAAGYRLLRVDPSRSDGAPSHPDQGSSLATRSIAAG